MLTVFTRPGCKACVSLKAWLTRQGIPFEEVNLNEHPEAEILLKTHNNGCSTVPAMMIGGYLLVGWRGGARERKWLEKHT